MRSNLAYIGKAMSLSVARLVHFGTTVAGVSGVRVSTRLKRDTLMNLSTCKLLVYGNSSMYVSQSAFNLDT